MNEYKNDTMAANANASIPIAPAHETATRLCTRFVSLLPAKSEGTNVAKIQATKAAAHEVRAISIVSFQRFTYIFSIIAE